MSIWSELREYDNGNWAGQPVTAGAWQMPMGHDFFARTGDTGIHLLETTHDAGNWCTS